MIIFLNINSMVHNIYIRYLSSKHPDSGPTVKYDVYTLSFEGIMKKKNYYLHVEFRI